MPQQQDNTGHRARLRQRFLADPTVLSDAETLELLLTYAIPRRDVAPLAQALLDYFGSPECSLTLVNAQEWRQKADQALANCQDSLKAALLDKATLLHSDALRERLARGTEEPFIAGLLEVGSPEEMAHYLTQALGGADIQKPDPVDLLRRYMKKLQVRKLRLTDFSPSKRTIERADVDGVVDEFRTFLSDALDAGEDELPVVELET